MSVDTAENRQYLQKHRLWILGDAITCKLMTTRPPNPVDAILCVLRDQQTKLQSPPNQPTPEDCSEAKPYLEKHRVASMIEDWLRLCLDTKPADAVQWSIDYFRRVAGEENDGVAQNKPKTAEAAPAAKTSDEAELDDML